MFKKKAAAYKKPAMASKPVPAPKKGCSCENCKCYCKGFVLIILGVLGILQYVHAVNLANYAFDIVWPVLVLVMGVLVLLGICCKLGE